MHEATSERPTVLRPPLLQGTLALDVTRMSDRSLWWMPQRGEPRRDPRARDCLLDVDEGEEGSRGAVRWVREADVAERRMLEQGATTEESTARTEVGVVEATEAITAGTR